jgi:putative Holliday junction resolvase
MGRWMALDVGAKRTGIAVTDPLRIIATALNTVSTHELVPFLKKYFEMEQVDIVIVGEPKQMDSTPSESSKMINNVITKLKQSIPNINIERMDERFTSKMASQVIAQSGKNKKERQKKELIDTVSATIILQSYMEAHQ